MGAFIHINNVLLELSRMTTKGWVKELCYRTLASGVLDDNGLQGYADKLVGDDRDVLKLRPGITGPATLKYRLEDEMISKYVAARQAAGDTRGMQEIAVEYNDTVIYPDKVRLNCYYYRHYSFVKDIQMIFCTVLGRKMEYAGEVI